MPEMPHDTMSPATGTFVCSMELDPRKAICQLRGGTGEEDIFSHISTTLSNSAEHCATRKGNLEVQLSMPFHRSGHEDASALNINGFAHGRSASFKSPGSKQQRNSVSTQQEAVSYSMSEQDLSPK